MFVPVKLGVGGGGIVLIGPGKAESVIGRELRVRAPIRAERLIGDDCLKRHPVMLRAFKRVFLFQVELAVMHTVQNHVHAGEVVGRPVQLLAKKAADIAMANFPRNAQQ